MSVPKRSKDAGSGTGLGMGARPPKSLVVPERFAAGDWDEAVPLLVFSMSTCAGELYWPPYRTLPSVTSPPNCAPPVGPTSVGKPVVVSSVYKLAPRAKYNVLEFVDRV